MLLLKLQVTRGDAPPAAAAAAAAGGGGVRRPSASALQVRQLVITPVLASHHPSASALQVR